VEKRVGLQRWYDDKVMPRLMTCACGQPAISAKRAELIPLASGRVLEIGCGGGLNQDFYDRERVTGFAGIDPNSRLLDEARARMPGRGWDVELRQAPGEDIPFAAGSFDTVVCTYTLCSVQDPSRVVAEIKRVLKAEGRLLFLEHGRAPDADVYRWQRWIEPLWKPLGGGCHLTRPVGGVLRAGGFSVEPLGQGYLARAPRPLGWMEWGVARR
jgi:ubiquinone/menaquinone biosynthesis C-methylase UbiE